MHTKEEKLKPVIKKLDARNQQIRNRRNDGFAKRLVDDLIRSDDR